MTHPTKVCGKFKVNNVQLYINSSWYAAHVVISGSYFHGVRNIFRWYLVLFHPPKRFNLTSTVTEKETKPKKPTVVTGRLLRRGRSDSVESQSLKGPPTKSPREMDTRMAENVPGPSCSREPSTTSPEVDPSMIECIPGPSRQYPKDPTDKSKELRHSPSKTVRSVAEIDPTPSCSKISRGRGRSNYYDDVRGEYKPPNTTL